MIFIKMPLPILIALAFGVVYYIGKLDNQINQKEDVK
ncbi:MAG: hypothetical protein ACFWT2_11770 [Thermoanaerobacterium thermosaccharolyticum]